MDEDEPSGRRPAAVPVVGEDLGPLSLAELSARIGALEAEIARTAAHASDAERRRRDADALFGRPSATG